MTLKTLLQRVALPEDLESFLAGFSPESLLRNGTLKQTLGLSSRELEEIYTEGYRAYQKADYTEASHAFRILAYLNPFEARYWMGLGASLQLLEKYEKALHSYAVAALLESDDPYPHFHAYECYLALHEKEEGSKAWQLALKRAKQDRRYAHLERKLYSLKGNLCPV